MDDADRRFEVGTVVMEGGEARISIKDKDTDFELYFTPSAALVLCGDLIEAYTTVLNLAKRQGTA